MSEAFREKQPQAQEPLVKKIDNVSVPSTNIEPPYLDYEMARGIPYIVEHFNLGDYWNETFEEEVRTIEDYFTDQIAKQEMSNKISSVKDRLKEIEKVTNMDKEDRSVVKMEILAEYVKFLMKTDDIKRNIKRYGSN